MDPLGSAGCGQEKYRGKVRGLAKPKTEGARLV